MRSGSAGALPNLRPGPAPRPPGTAELPLPPRPAQRHTTPSRLPANLQVQLLEKAGEEPRKPARVHGVEQRHGPADAGRREKGVSEGPWPRYAPAPWRYLLCSAPPPHGPARPGPPGQRGPAGAAPPQHRYLSLSGTMGAAMAAARAHPLRRLGGAKRCRAALSEGSANPEKHGMNLVGKDISDRPVPGHHRAPPCQLDYSTGASRPVFP